MLKGEAATEQCVIIDDVNFLNNADLDGKQLPPAGAPNIMMAAGGTQLKKVLEDDGIYVWKFHVDWEDPTKTKLDGPVKIPVAPYRYLVRRPADATACRSRAPSGGSTPRATRSWRGSSIAGSATASRSSRVHSVNTAAGGGGVRWYEFRRRTKTATSRCTSRAPTRPDGFYRWMASPAIDGSGNIGIGYSFGGTPHFAGQRFAGRLADDPPGVLTLREAVLVEGEGAQTNTMRWEDYTQTAIDPERRLHDLVRRRLPQEGRDELLDPDRRVPAARLPAVQ